MFVIVGLGNPDKKYEHTYLIGEDILSITDVDKLLNYIGENSVNFTENNAFNIINICAKPFSFCIFVSKLLIS